MLETVAQERRRAVRGEDYDVRVDSKIFAIAGASVKANAAWRKGCQERSDDWPGLEILN